MDDPTQTNSNTMLCLVCHEVHEEFLWINIGRSLMTICLACGAVSMPKDEREKIRDNLRRQALLVPRALKDDPGEHVQ